MTDPIEDEYKALIASLDLDDDVSDVEEALDALTPAEMEALLAELEQGAP